MAEYKEESEIDCTHTMELVCPYCGYEYGDSWEFLGMMGKSWSMNAKSVA